MRQRIDTHQQRHISFNPRTHEGCDVAEAPVPTELAGFNPRTHEGCDSLTDTLLTHKVSFNPRTHEGCDSLTDTLLTHKVSFNPRTHEGCDLTYRQFLNYPKVSIHAPTRGATVRASKPVTQSLFQSTHPRGVRPENLSIFVKLNSFNPRTHEGCDIKLLLMRLFPICFNPRTHEGCD